MKRFTQLMSLLFMAAVTQYSCINDADVAFPMRATQIQTAILPYSLKSPMKPHSQRRIIRRDRDWLKG